MVGISDDDVVEDFDLEKLAGSDEIASNFDIRFWRSRFPARMIVLCAAPSYVQPRIGCSDIHALFTARMA